MTREPAVLETLSGAPVLIVVFGGVRQGIGIDVPPFEFLRSLSHHRCDAIFVRDFQQAWYQLGVDGIAGDVAGVARWLRSRREAYARTITLGNSMGGFAALLFGRLSGFDLSIAFNPQTTIEPSARASFGDRRWQALLERTYARVTDGRYLDVLSVLQEQEEVPARQRSILFFGTGSTLDAVHARRLAGERDVHLFGVRNSDHQAIRVLRDTGRLARFIGMACDLGVGREAMLDDLRADRQLTTLVAAKEP